MIITRKFHFYAAHRNEALTHLKCSRLHGHKYDLEVDFDVGNPNSDTAVTTLFDDLERCYDPLILKLDHRTLAHAGDPHLTKALPDDWMVVLPFPTSAENLAAFIYMYGVVVTPMRINAVRLQETQSCVVEFTSQHYNEFLGYSPHVSRMMKWLTREFLDD